MPSTRTFEELKEQASQLPQLPGVYIMRDAEENIIYIGKAKSLKSRVSQYFARLASHSVKTRRMVSQISRFETIFASSEFDALLLENTLIKKHKPKYNILLKDDKGYPYVRIEQKPYARMEIVSQRTSDNASHFGPYGGRGSAKTAIEIATETFKLPTCSRIFPRDIKKDRPCLRYQMKKCCGVCTGLVSEERYAEIMTQVKMMLSGDGRLLEQELSAKMEALAEELDFESAALYRDRMKMVQRLGKSRVVTGITMSDMDIVAYECKNGRACIAQLCYIQGILSDKKIMFFDGLEPEDASDTVESFITQFYGRAGYAPRELYVSCEIENREQVQQLLSQLRRTKCHIEVPQRGEKQGLVQLALQNASLELDAVAIKEERSAKTLEMLKEMLALDKLPRLIEAIDISNTAGSDAVGLLTVFENGQPKRGLYRQFKIKEAQGGDDYGSMAEVLGRRLDRAISGDSSFLPLPDLFLMDGGFGQVGVARAELEKRSIAIPVFGMVKDDKHRTRGLVGIDGGEIGLAATPPIFAFVGRIQEETHKNAVAYHHKVHGKRVKNSALDAISGIGESRKRLLLRHFGSITAIKSASCEQLCEVVPKNAAESIIQHFSKSEEK